MEVCVLNNGSVERAAVVNGVYTLKTAALAGQTVIVGLSYIQEIETLNIAAAELGSMKGKIFKIDVDFYRSRGGYIGTHWDRLDEIWQRTAERLGEPTEIYTQKYSMTPDSNNEIYKSVKIRQADPLPMTITAITAHLDAAQ
jgi:hypothetical protein